MPPTSQEPPSGKGSSVTLQLGIPPALSLGTRQLSGRKEAPGPAYFHWRGGGGAGHAGSDNFLHLHRHTGLRNVITSKRGQRPSPPTHGGTPPHKGHLAGPEQEAIRSSRVLAVHPTGGCAATTAYGPEAVSATGAKLPPLKQPQLMQAVSGFPQVGQGC